MTVQITVQSALFGLLGGFLIAIATSINLFLKGRITGMSGMFYSLITLDFASGFLWKIAALLGIVSSVSICNLIWQTSEVIANIQIFDVQGEITAGLNYVGFGIAGYLVGFGTKMGNGCTSGHGVCGLPRLSIRSIIAVGCFLTTSIGIATLRYYVPFLSETQTVSQEKKTDFQACSVAILVISSMVLSALIYKLWNETKKLQDVWVSYIVGFIFGSGLAFSGMTRRSKILGFLIMYSQWDPTLMFVIGGAVGLNLFTFHYIINKAKKPLFGEKLEIPTNKVIDRRLIIGSSIFGLGWGLGGLCPGPALAMYSAFTFQIGIVWMFFLALGQLTVTKLEQFISQLKAKDIQPNSQKILPHSKIEVQNVQPQGQLPQGQPPVQNQKDNKQNQEQNPPQVNKNNVPLVDLPKIENIDHQHDIEVLNKKGSVRD